MAPVTKSSVHLSALSEPLTFSFSGKRAPNRFLKGAMSEELATYSDTNEFARGWPTDELVRLYETWKDSGLGNIMIHRAHLEAKGNAVLDLEIPTDYTLYFARLVKAVKSDSLTPPLIIGQLSHSGRQVTSDIQMHPVSASDVQQPDFLGRLYAKPSPVTVEGIRDIVARFAFAAKVLHKAGYDGIEIHGGHGYLITQFLSTRTNQRTDSYGGSLENRSRILLDIVTAIKEAVDDRSFVFGIKLNSHDFIDGGLTPKELRELILRLEQAEVDYIELSEVSRATFIILLQRESTKRREAYYLEFSDAVRLHLTKTKLAVTGGFRSAQAMINALESGSTDLIGIASPLAHEPHIAADILAGISEGAKPTKLVPHAGIQIRAANAQIERRGRGLAPLDFSIQEVADLFTTQLMTAIGVAL